MEESSGHAGGGHTVQGLVDDGTVSRNEIGVVMENVEKVMDNTLEDDSDEEDKVVEYSQYVAYKTNVAQQFTPQKHYRLPHPGQGASSHLNFNASNLSTIFDKRLFPSVYVGDGKSIPVTNTGHSIIPSHHRPLHLHNVLVTPNIIKNLISVRQLTRDNNCTIEFNAFGFSMKDYLTRHILLRCDSSSDLYPVTKPSTSPIAFLSTSALHVASTADIRRSLYGLKQAPRAWFQRVLQGTLELGLQLYASATTSLVGYTDADWAGCPSTRRSTSGYCVFLGDNLLSWSAKRQHTISRSSAEAEYRGVANVVAETAWIRNLLRELHSPLLTATLVYCDNVSAVYMSANPVQHQRTKHIEIDIHFVRDMVKAGHVRVLHVPSRFQYADIFTKGIPSTLFEDFRSSLSVRPPPAPTAGAY
ncbi:ribonuclease H-like domain-containing protein [Tanacetum coccineum]|uniref:Ribonuclease H-like domain-containing protein n=1 Tax=Tanacetum coccineum TaxID=301880 RepID=A0ABQ4ZTA7_9ASTR